jgi:S1-C subfamily serine protease
MRRMKTIVLGLGLTAALLVGASRSHADEVIYQKTAKSTLMFLMNGRPIGTGVLVDVPKRIVATAEHVTAAYQGGKIEVAFADIVEGEAVTALSHYTANLKKHAIAAKVLHSDSVTDLSLLQLEHLPANAVAIPLAKKSPLPGSQLHVVGNSDSGDGKVFSYCRGYVRNSAAGRGGMMIHHTPTNRGDSGGPIVNSKGELVGLVSNGTSGMGSGEVIYFAFQLFKEMQKNPNLTINPARGTPQVRDYAVGLANIQATLREVLGKGVAAR